MNDTGMKMFDNIIVIQVMILQSDKIWDEIWMDAPKLLFIFLLVEYKYTHFPWASLNLDVANTSLTPGFEPL